MYEPPWLVLARYVLGCMLAVVTGAIMFNLDWFSSFQITIWGWAMRTGSLVSILSLVLLRSSHKALGDNFSTTIETGQVHGIVQSGPYRWIRHPMYVAYVGVFCGLGLVVGNWLFTFLGLAIMCSLMFVRTRYEEDALVLRFPEQYMRYKQHTGAFFPRFGSSR